MVATTLERGFLLSTSSHPLSPFFGVLSPTNLSSFAVLLASASAFDQSDFGEREGRSVFRRRRRKAHFFLLLLFPSAGPSRQRPKKSTERKRGEEEETEGRTAASTAGGLPFGKGPSLQYMGRERSNNLSIF